MSLQVAFGRASGRLFACSGGVVGGAREGRWAGVVMVGGGGAGGGGVVGGGAGGREGGGVRESRSTSE